MAPENQHSMERRQMDKKILVVPKTPGCSEDMKKFGVSSGCTIGSRAFDASFATLASHSSRLSHVQANSSKP